jgi:ferredoxin-thioredoxin reductase catalytic subunit
MTNYIYFAELDAKDIHGEEFWKWAKNELDSLNSARKLNGKPDEYDRILLNLDKNMIRWLKIITRHSVRLGIKNCPCPMCDDKRKELMKMTDGPK